MKPLPTPDGKLHNAAPQTLALAADGWLDIVRPGEYPHPTGILQKVDAADLAEMLANFNAHAAAKAAQWGGIAGYQGHPEAKGEADSAAALAWFKEARIQDGVLQFRAEFNGAGKAAVDDKQLKYLSPYWFYRRDAAGNARPFWIQSIGLTNNPVIKDQAPLANAEMLPAPATAAVPAAPAVPANWTAMFTGKLAEFIKDAKTPEEAAALISRTVMGLWDQIDTLQAFRTLLNEFAETLGEDLDFDGDMPQDQLATSLAKVGGGVKAALANAKAGHQATVALNALILHRAQAEKKIAPSQVNAAQRMIAADPAAFCALYWGLALDAPALVNAAPAMEAGKPAATLPAPPASPLKGLTLANAGAVPSPVAGRERKPTADETKLINAAVAKRVDAGEPHHTAFNAVWDSFQHGNALS